jgi:hypothetical protein
VKRIKLVYYILAIAALLAGIAIYALFRNINDMILFQFFSKPVILDSFHFQVTTDTLWMYLFIFNLPHGLWCFSILLIIRAIWIHNIRWRMFYGGLFIAAAFVIEIAQLSENVPGTFDVFDLASYGFFAFVESIIFNLFIKRRIF